MTIMCRITIFVMFYYFILEAMYVLNVAKNVHQQ